MLVSSMPVTIYSRTYTVLKKSIKYLTQSTLCIKNVGFLYTNIAGDVAYSVDVLIMYFKGL